ncbi:putative hemolysin [Cyclospora cayetanensis]|uniref:Hemolysin n=1 Tax=Cyclospora cayetanensis TaxID=88456 RepID=A0A1D3CX15_9EIME|nr:putative hemolysin [Cyclospora cayetanensis]
MCPLQLLTLPALVGLVWTVVFGVYIILWLALAPFYGGLPAFALLFPRPLVVIVAASGAFTLFVSGSLATAGALMTASGLQQHKRQMCSCYLSLVERREIQCIMWLPPRGMTSCRGHCSGEEQHGVIHGLKGNAPSEKAETLSTPTENSSPEGVGRTTKYRSISSSDSRDTTGLAIVSADEDVLLVRPKLRGKIHLGLLLLSPVWVFLMLSACKSVVSIIAAVAVVIMTMSALCLFGLEKGFVEWLSYMLKRPLRNYASERAATLSGIFVVISSCTTPIPMLLLDFWPSVLLLSVQGMATLYGFWIILFGDLSSGARQRRAFTYIAIGLLHAVFLKAYISVLTAKEIALVLSLAGFYIVGALVYGSRWPDPCPTHFGFHELFHLFCCFSFLLTLWLNYEVITRAELEAQTTGVSQPSNS